MIRVVPTTLKAANAFVKERHRHHKPTVGHKFSIAIADETKIRGVAIMGRPVSRYLDDGFTLEVNRCCTDGVKNGCSMLYGAARRASKAMGYSRIITYILGDESGTTLKASGWSFVGERGGGTWNRKARSRSDSHPLQKKLLYEAINGAAPEISR